MTEYFEKKRQRNNRTEKVKQSGFINYIELNKVGFNAILNASFKIRRLVDGMKIADYAV